jgi:hypothetical protein
VLSVECRVLSDFRLRIGDCRLGLGCGGGRVVAVVVEVVVVFVLGLRVCGGGLAF